ncbi:MAG: protease modulator HflC [Alphaproteobacteria bacterium]|nr:protease modulator HflC [Alphaproteobacteria bacterium]
MSNNMNYIIALAALIVILIGGSIFFVKETEQVLVLQFGEVKQQIEKPGIHFKIPLIQQTRIFERRILNVDPPAEELLLSDQKRLVVDVFARYRIKDMLKFFQALGTETAANQRLNTIINASLRGVLGKNSLASILSDKRDVLMAEIQKQVNEDTNRFGLEIVDVRIVRADLPTQVTQATYARMQSEREREAKEARAQGEELALQIRSKADKERSIMLAEAQKEAQIVRGEGDKEAIKIYADAFNRDPQFYGFYRSMEAYRNALADPETTMVLTPDSGFLRYLKAKPTP